MISLPVAATALVLLLLAAWLLLRRRPTPAAPVTAAAPPVIPPGVALKPQPLLTREEATLYNLLKLAVQDRYLVLAQVPLWCLVEATADTPDRRRAFLNAIAFKRVDFALVHPGTLAVEKVVEVDAPEPPTPQRRARARLLEALCGEIGVELVRLDPATAGTPALAARLGVQPED